MKVYICSWTKKKKKKKEWVINRVNKEGKRGANR